jgi:hypothetical protein
MSRNNRATPTIGYQGIRFEGQSVEESGAAVLQEQSFVVFSPSDVEAQSQVVSLAGTAC